MAGLGSRRQGGNVTWLTLAGGYVWNRKAEEDDPDYYTQEYETSDGKKSRSGAAYDDITGTIIDVYFKTHDQYGENVNIKLDINGEHFIISANTTNRYGSSLMKGLLKADFDKEVFLKPYDFVDKENKRVIGVTWRQDGEKLELHNDDAPNFEGDWGNKKKVKRYYEDLAEWFVSEVEAEVCPIFNKKNAEEEKREQYDSEDHEEPKAEEPKKKPRSLGGSKKSEPKEEEEKKVSVVQMRKAIKAYIAENYEDEEMPKLSKEDVAIWYQLVLDEEELPFESEAATEEPSGKVDDAELQSELEDLIG